MERPPPKGVGQRIKHISWSDQGGRLDGVQIMLNRRHLYIGHQFTDGFTVMDASDPRNLKPVKYILTAPNTSTHHLQVAEDILLVGKGANIMAMQSYDDGRSYFENTLADSITKKKPFRAGLSIYDIKTDPAAPREIAFLQMPGLGINRLWWTGGRYAYVAAHFDGFTDHILCIVDLKTITKPEIVSRAWLPGMNRAAKGAQHHATRQACGAASYDRGGKPRLRRLARRRVHHSRHQRSGEAQAAVAHQLVAALCRRHAHAAAASGAQARPRRRGIERRELREGHVLHLGGGRAGGQQSLPIGTLPTPKDRNYCAIGNFGPHNLHENRPGSFQSEETIFATYHNAGVRVFDIRDQFAPKEIAYWVPPAPTKLVDTHAGVALAPQSCDVYVTPEGLMYVSDWNAGLHVLQYEGDLYLFRFARRARASGISFSTLSPSSMARSFGPSARTEST